MKWLPEETDYFFEYRMGIIAFFAIIEMGGIWFAHLAGIL